MTDDPRTAVERRIDDLEGDLYEARRELQMLRSRIERAVRDLNHCRKLAAVHQRARRWPETAGALDGGATVALIALGYPAELEQSEAADVA